MTNEGRSQDGDDEEDKNRNEDSDDVQKVRMVVDGTNKDVDNMRTHGSYSAL